jgi:hypothetical protein
VILSYPIIIIIFQVSGVLGFGWFWSPGVGETPTPDAHSRPKPKTYPRVRAHTVVMRKVVIAEDRMEQGEKEKREKEDRLDGVHNVLN